MGFVSKVIAKILSDRERVKQHQPSKEDIKEGLRRKGSGRMTVDIPSQPSKKTEEKEKPLYQKKKGNVIVPEAFKQAIKREVEDKEVAKDALELAKEGWIDPKMAESLLARFPDGEARDFIKKLLSREGATEPYLGSSHSLQWRVSEQSPVEKKLPHPIPQNVKDLRGTLGKDVPLGGSDPFVWMDSKYSITKNLLKKNKDKPLTINTRSDLIAHDDYIAELNPQKHKIRIHVLTTDFELGRYLEPGAPSFSRRLKAAKRLVEHGFSVTMVVDVLEHTHLPPELKKKLTTMLQVKSAVGDPKIKVAENKVKLTEGALSKILHAAGFKKEEEKVS
jgi:hypothetical protein